MSTAKIVIAHPSLGCRLAVQLVLAATEQTTFMMGNSVSTAVAAIPQIRFQK